MPLPHDQILDELAVRVYARAFVARGGDARALERYDDAIAVARSVASDLRAVDLVDEIVRRAGRIRRGVR